MKFYKEGIYDMTQRLQEQHEATKCIIKIKTKPNDIMVDFEWQIDGVKVKELKNILFVGDTAEIEIPIVAKLSCDVYVKN